MAEDMWSVIHTERAALASDLADLTPEQWATQSLCDQWNVHQALAHMTTTAKLNPLGFIGRFVGSGFSFQKFAAKGIAAEGSGTPSQTLAAFRAVQDSSTSPPGPKATWLGETLVHAEDIRRPLGISHDYPLPALTQAIDFYSNSNALIGGKDRIAGLTLKANDTNWSCGDGPVVEGPALSLLMATTGRRIALDDLTGPGLETLRSR